MDAYILFSVLSMTYSWTLCTALAAPAGETPAAANVTPGRHVRTKRCSCATLLDKECVYFCHLDIIWVNTPERVVSYGLGSAPRKRRAAAESMATSGGPRCRCYRQSDGACRNFCRLEEQLRYGTLPDAAISSSAEGDGSSGARSKQELAADTGRIKRTTGGSEERVSPQAVGTAFKTRLLLERWRARRRTS